MSRTARVVSARQTNEYLPSFQALFSDKGSILLGIFFILFMISLSSLFLIFNFKTKSSSVLSAPLKNPAPPAVSERRFPFALLAQKHTPLSLLYLARQKPTPLHPFPRSKKNQRSIYDWK